MLRNRVDTGDDTGLHRKLGRAEAQGFTSIAFPSISTGIFGYPPAQGAASAAQAVADFYLSHPASPLREVRFVLIDAPTVAIFQQALAAQFGSVT